MESNKSIIGYQLLENVEIAQKQKANLFVYKNPMDVLQNYPPACAAKSQALYAVLYIEPRTYLGVYRRFMDRKLFQNNKCARTAAMDSVLCQ